METISAEKAEEILEEFEAPTRKFTGPMWYIATALAVFCSLFALYGAFASMITQVVRYVHVMLILMLTFLYYPPSRGLKQRALAVDIFLAILVFVAFAYPFLDLEAFMYRVPNPLPMDVALGVLACILVLEATRRATGIALPIVVLVCIAYAYWGGILPEPWGHRGYTITRMVALEYMTLNGLFGTPVEVSSTFIILFTIFGAILELSGAGQFFVDFALGCMGKSRAGAGRAVTLASFLLGTVSGSGAATTVTLGSVAWPLLKRSGYDKDSAGGLLAAGGIGAILSPPVLGAASFLIAEILRISYLQGPDNGVRADYPLLCLHPFHGAGRLAPLRAKACEPGKDRCRGAYQAVLVSFRLPGHYRHIHGPGVHRDHGGFLQHPDRHRDELPQQGLGAFSRKLIEALAAGDEAVPGRCSYLQCAGIIVGVINLTGIGLSSRASSSI